MWVVGGGIAVGYSYSPSTWLPSISCLWMHPGSLARTKGAKYDPVKNNLLTSIDIRTTCMTQNISLCAYRGCSIKNYTSKHVIFL